MAETKAPAAKLVTIEFGAEHKLLEGQTSIYGVEVEAVEDADGNVTKYVGKCSAEELKAFKDGGRV